MKTVSDNEKRNRTLAFLLFSISVIAIVGSIALPSWADCFYEGKRYSTGDRMGPYVCHPDGTWQPY